MQKDEFLNRLNGHVQHAEVLRGQVVNHESFLKRKRASHDNFSSELAEKRESLRGVMDFIDEKRLLEKRLNNMVSGFEDLEGYKSRREAKKALKEVTSELSYAEAIYKKMAEEQNKILDDYSASWQEIKVLETSLDGHIFRLEKILCEINKLIAGAGFNGYITIQDFKNEDGSIKSDPVLYPFTITSDGSLVMEGEQEEM